MEGVSNISNCFYILLNKIPVLDIPSKIFPNSFNQGTYFLDSVNFSAEFLNDSSNFLQKFSKTLDRYYPWIKKNHHHHQATNVIINIGNNIESSINNVKYSDKGEEEEEEEKKQ